MAFSSEEELDQWIELHPQDRVKVQEPPLPFSIEEQMNLLNARGEYHLEARETEDGPECKVVFTFSTPMGDEATVEYTDPMAIESIVTLFDSAADHLVESLEYGFEAVSEELGLSSDKMLDSSMIPSLEQHLNPTQTVSGGENNEGAGGEG